MIFNADETEEFSLSLITGLSRKRTHFAVFISEILK